MSQPNGVEIHPAPTDEEAAAIMAAWSVLWPTAAEQSGADTPPDTGWRFKNRWWIPNPRGSWRTGR